MAKQSGLLVVVTWLVGVLVSLAVGFGMINEALTVPGIPAVIMIIAGWIVVVGTVLSVLMAVFTK